jgi:cell division septation protein DedD
MLALSLLSACNAGVRWEAAMNDGQTALQRDDLAKAEQRFTAAARLAEGFEPVDLRRGLTAEKLAELEVAMIQRVGPGPKPLQVAAPHDPAAPSPQTPPVAGGEAFAVHLASFRTEDRARRGWRQLQQTFPDLLGTARLTLERADLGEFGVFQRVLSGPFAERAAAAQLCSQLKAKAQYCRVVRRRSAG